jgi:hypothetical protein
MAAGKNSLMDLKSELNALKSDLGDPESSSDDSDATNDMMNLKRRMDKADQEMRAMTEAMKSTLLDVRALMQDMDNPFNMLRDMGVDKLVNKAVETVEDEVNKQKREEAKKRMAGDGRGPEAIIAQLGGQAASAPMSAGNAASQSMAPLLAPSMVSPSPQVGIPLGSPQTPNTYSPQNAARPTPGYSEPAINGNQLQGYGPQSPSYGGGLTQIEENVNSLMKRVAVTEQAVPLILKRVSRTEEAVGELSDSVQELIDSLKGERRKSSRERPRRSSSYSYDLDADEAKNPGEVYYEAYVSLVADYLVLRFGEKGSEEILLEGMYKGWASPRVVRDIMDHTASISKTKDRKAPLPFEMGEMNNEMEDKILLTSLLKNLDKPVSEWTEPTHLFLLLALVTRARENKLNRSEP